DVASDQPASRGPGIYSDFHLTVRHRGYGAIGTDSPARDGAVYQIGNRDRGLDDAGAQFRNGHGGILAEEQRGDPDDVRGGHAGAVEELILIVRTPCAGKNLHAGGTNVDGLGSEIRKVRQTIVSV